MKAGPRRTALKAPSSSFPIRGRDRGRCLPLNLPPGKLLLLLRGVACAAGSHRKARPPLASCSHRPRGSRHNSTAHPQSAGRHNRNGRANSTSGSRNDPPAARRRNIAVSSVPSASSSFHTPGARHVIFLHSQPTVPQMQLLAGVPGGDISKEL